MGERRVAGRRLAAILAADVVGYSRMVRADEEGTIARLRALRRDLIDPAIDRHSGRIIKTMGDGLLIEFASVVDAVRCAVAVQRAMVSRNAEVAEDKRIIFRVGVNLGDVVIEGDGDILGDGINIASRLEGLAEPGGICLSAAAFEQVRDKLPITFVDLGEQTVKNIDRPVRVYALGGEALAQLPNSPTLATTASSRPNIRLRMLGVAIGLVAVVVLVPVIWFGMGGGGLERLKSPPPLSIVVLPFSNLSGDPQQEYFADGITEDVTTDLSRIRGTFVIAHNTAETYKGKSLDARQIAQKLGIRYVLEGSVEREGDLVRTNVQFIDGNTGAQLWADRFDGERTKIFDLQNQITGRIANSLRSELIRTASLQMGRAGNADAQDYVMRAWALRAKPITKENLEQTERLFERALALDGRSADAWSGLSFVLSQEEVEFPDAQRSEQLQRAADAAKSAIALDADFAEPHAAIGLVRIQQRRFDEASTELNRAIALDPNMFRAYAGLGLVQMFLGDLDRAIALYMQAVKLSPRDPAIAIWYGAISTCYSMLGDDKEAIRWSLMSRSANADYMFAYVNLASAYALQGQETEARAALAEARRLNPRLSINLLRIWGSTERDYQKRAERWLDGLRKAGLPEK